MLHGTFIFIESFCFLIDLSLHSGKKSSSATKKIKSIQFKSEKDFDHFISRGDFMINVIK